MNFQDIVKAHEEDEKLKAVVEADGCDFDRPAHEHRAALIELVREMMPLLKDYIQIAKIVLEIKRNEPLTALFIKDSIRRTQALLDRLEKK